MKQAHLPGKVLVMVVLKMILQGLAWGAVGAAATWAVSSSLNGNDPYWLNTAVTLAVLGLWIGHLIWSDKKATKRASQAALEHRIKNA